LRTHNYTYSLIGQLTGSTRRLQPSGGPLTTRNYGYDGADNRVRNDLQTSVFNPADQITSITGAATATSYFPTGSLKDDQANGHFAYDWREQLEHYVRGSTDARYAYNGNNLRVEKVVNGERTQYLLDGGEVLKEYNGNGTVKASYFLGATGRQAIKTGGQWYIYLKDTHGSMTGLVDLAGNRVATYEADPYGEPIVDQGTIYNPYRWNGEQLDAESGLTYMRNRYYQAATGRFIQRDPIGYAGGLNLYSFGNSDPVNNSDPWGLDDEHAFNAQMAIIKDVGYAGAAKAEADVIATVGLAMGAAYEVTLFAGPALAYGLSRLAGLRARPCPPATFGSSTNKGYAATFSRAHPETRGKVVVHHAVEQKVPGKYPSAGVTQSEMHSPENLRGVPKGAVNSRIHLSEIRKSWNQFYNQFDATNTSPTKQQLLDKATEIDQQFGKYFNPPR
jgi:RHS repeat-associated protein